MPLIDVSSAAASLASSLASDIAALSATTPHTSAVTRTLTDASGSPSVVTVSMVSSPPAPSATPTTSGPTVATVTVYGEDRSVLTSYTTTMLPSCTDGAVGGGGGGGGLLGGVGLGGGWADAVAVGVTVWLGVLLVARLWAAGTARRTPVEAVAAAGAREGEEASAGR